MSADLIETSPTTVGSKSGNEILSGNKKAFLEVISHNYVIILYLLGKRLMERTR